MVVIFDIIVVGVVAAVTVAVGVIIVSRSSIDFSFLIPFSLSLGNLCRCYSCLQTRTHTASYFVIVALCAVSFHF